MQESIPITYSAYIRHGDLFCFDFLGKKVKNSHFLTEDNIHYMWCKLFKKRYRKTVTVVIERELKHFSHWE